MKFSRRATSCAAMPTIRISSSPPTRERRRSPISPTRSPPSTASGSATPSRQAARPVTITRAWASPRAADGRRSSATSASWVSTRRAKTSRSSASATCPATCSATHCCSRRTSRCWRRSITRTSSSIRRPIPRPASPSGSGCSTIASTGMATIPRSSRPAARCSSAARRRCRSRRKFNRRSIFRRESSLPRS